jgi:hypothetical protein
LSLASMIFVASSVEAKARDKSISAPAVVANSIQPQWQNRGRWERRNNRAVRRVFIQTRFVRYGRRIFRETYRVVYLPNGRTQSTLISRVRVQ